MGFPRKFQHLFEIELEDVAKPNTAWLTYTVCATNNQSCGWGGWMLEGVFGAPRQGKEGVRDGTALSSASEQICPRCGGVTFRTGATVRMTLSPDQEKEPALVPGVDYEVAPIEYDDELTPTAEKLADLPSFKWMESRIPPIDALSTFVPEAPSLEPIIEQALDRFGRSRWRPVAGGHVVLFPYDGEPYDKSRFTVEPEAWDHEHCEACGVAIPAMTPCRVTESGAYVLLCEGCYERLVVNVP